MADNTHSTNKIQIGYGSRVSSGQQGNIVTSEEVIVGSVIHQNAAQDILVTTVDRVRLCLIDFENALKSQRDWITALGMLLAILTTLVAADFKDFLNIPSNVWQSVFVVGGLICFVWLILSIVNALKQRSRTTIDYVIGQIKYRR